MILNVQRLAVLVWSPDRPDEGIAVGKPTTRLIRRADGLVTRLAKLAGPVEKTC
jgi:hypothetical protein